MSGWWRALCLILISASISAFSLEVLRRRRCSDYGPAWSLSRIVYRMRIYGGAVRSSDADVELEVHPLCHGGLMPHVWLVNLNCRSDGAEGEGAFPPGVFGSQWCREARRAKGSRCCRLGAPRLPVASPQPRNGPSRRFSSRLSSTWEFRCERRNPASA